MAKKIPTRKFPATKKKIPSSKFPETKRKIPSRKFPKAATSKKPDAPLLPDRPASEEARQDRLKTLKGKVKSLKRGSEIERPELGASECPARLNAQTPSRIPNDPKDIQ